MAPPSGSKAPGRPEHPGITGEARILHTLTGGQHLCRNQFTIAMSPDRFSGTADLSKIGATFFSWCSPPGKLHVRGSISGETHGKRPEINGRMSKFGAQPCVCLGGYDLEEIMADSGTPTTRSQTHEVKEAPVMEHACRAKAHTVSILADALLDVILQGGEGRTASSRKPLISGSQPALLGGEDGAEKPRTRGRR